MFLSHESFFFLVPRRSSILPFNISCSRRYFSLLKTWSRYSIFLHLTVVNNFRYVPVLLKTSAFVTLSIQEIRSIRLKIHISKTSKRFSVPTLSCFCWYLSPSFAQLLRFFGFLQSVLMHSQSSTTYICQVCLISLSSKIALFCSSHTNVGERLLYPLLPLPFYEY